MSYCHYHPRIAATHYCAECDTDNCDACIDESHKSLEPHCLLCGKGLKNLGATADVTPFWRRIDKAFRYPMNTEVLITIGIISLFSSISSLLPLPLMAGMYLLCTGVMVKYCFNCLSSTALGAMTPPSVTTAYGGGILLIFRIFLMFVLITIAIGLLYAQVSQVLASLLGIFVIVALPAMIMLYSMSESLIESLNPLKLIKLITAIGLPYVLILALLMVMMGSVDLLSQIIYVKDSFFLLTLQSMVSNFYSVVMFHLMGYVIFQYQHRLGFVAPEITDETKKSRTEAEKDLARIQMMIKQGYWQSAQEAFSSAVKKHPTNEPLNTHFFRFTLAGFPKQTASTSPNAAIQKITQAANHIFDQYFSFLIGRGMKEKLYLNYQLALRVLPHYQPTPPMLRYELAKACQQHANNKAVIKLLNGLHKAFPDYVHLIPAYELLSDALEGIPTLTDRAAQCRRLVEHLRQKKSTYQQTQRDSFNSDNVPESKIDQEMPPSPPVKSRQQNTEAINSSLPLELVPLEFKP